ncbi:MAG: hypothetical protein EON86_11825, partial [Brevundimonas sp.]
GPPGGVRPRPARRRPFPSGRDPVPLRRLRWRRSLELPGRMRRERRPLAWSRRPSRRRHRARGRRRL